MSSGSLQEVKRTEEHAAPNSARDWSSLLLQDPHVKMQVFMRQYLLITFYKQPHCPENYMVFIYWDAH